MHAQRSICACEKWSYTWQRTCLESQITSVRLASVSTNDPQHSCVASAKTEPICHSVLTSAREWKRWLTTRVAELQLFNFYKLNTVHKHYGQRKDGDVSPPPLRVAVRSTQCDIWPIRACSLAQPANITHLIELDFGWGGSPSLQRASLWRGVEDNPKDCGISAKEFNNDETVNNKSSLDCKFEKKTNTIQ